MNPPIWIRMPGIGSHTLTEILNRTLEEEDLEEISHRICTDNSDGLLDTPMWLEISFRSVEALLQLLGILAAYKGLKISTNPEGRDAKTISKGAGEKELRESIEGLSRGGSSENARTSNRKRKSKRKK